MIGGKLSGVPVLDYHRVGSVMVRGEVPDRFGVSDSAFRNHLQLIQDLKLRVVSPEEIAAGDIADNAVALTFDDGYLSHYEVVFPLLSEFSATGTFFVNTSSISTDGFLDWKMAKEMSRAGMRFGSHAHNHVVLTTLNARQLRDELEVSRQVLEQHLSCAAQVLAVPYGFCDQRVVEAAWEAGYTLVCNSKPWPAQPGERLLSRVGVMGQTSLDDLRKLLENDSAVYWRLWGRDRALALPRYVFVRLRPGLLGVRTAEKRL